MDRNDPPQVPTLRPYQEHDLTAIRAAFDALGVAHGIIAAGYPETEELPVQVASVATLVRRLDKLASPRTDTLSTARPSDRRKRGAQSGSS